MLIMKRRSQRLKKRSLMNFQMSQLSLAEAVATATNILDLLGGAIRLTALVTLISGIAVLAGTVASSEAQRLSDSIILKVLGAAQRYFDCLAFGICAFGIADSPVRLIIGTVASAALISGFLRADFYADLTVIASTAIIGAAATALGLFGAWRSLGHRPARIYAN